MDTNKRTRIWLLAGIGTLVLAGGAWGVVSLVGKKHASADDATKDMFAQAKDNPGKMFDEFRAKMEDKSLSDAERRKLRDSMRKFWDDRMDEHTKEYFTAKPEDRTAIINRHIDEMEKMRKEREEREQAELEKARADGKTEEDLKKEREKRREEWRKREDSKSREERKAESESRDPNKMAQRMAYMSAMRKQMKARGIDPPRFGGMGGGRGGPRG